MIVTLTPPRVTAIVFVISAATIAGAWAFELIGGLPPCPMCLQQRWAYYLVLPLMAVAGVFALRQPGSPVLRGLLGLAGLIMLGGAGLAAFHSGVEWGWWQGPTGCSGGVEFGTGSNVLPNFGDAQVIRCDEAAWRMFGLSLAGYNALISVGVAALAIMTALRGSAYGSSSVSQ